jgi:hypothetical protein
MEDQEIAAFLRDQCRRRLTGLEHAIVSGIADGVHLNEKGEWRGVDDRRVFEGLKTQFAAELAHAGKVVVK